MGIEELEEFSEDKSYIFFSNIIRKLLVNNAKLRAIDRTSQSRSPVNGSFRLNYISLLMKFGR